MIIKQSGQNKSSLSHFDLLGSDEKGLAKAFAYLLGREPLALFEFLKCLGVDARNSKSNFLSTKINIERVREEGRTDIEIRQKAKYHIIIECKVGSNKVRSQRTQYLNSFDNEPHKILCFITQNNDFKRQRHDDIIVHNLGWIDIIPLFEDKRFVNKPLVKEFMNFAIKGLKMREQKEVLIQDLSKRVEIKRFRDNRVYRRDVVYGSPLYFAPYFTREAAQSEGAGISYLSKVLGILTLSSKNIQNFEEDLSKFTKNKRLITKWKKGVAVKGEKTHTYFFLDEPVKLNSPLKKDGTIKKGRGKNWIAAMIPKNRCVSFAEFTRRIVMQNNRPRK